MQTYTNCTNFSKKFLFFCLKCELIFLKFYDIIFIENEKKGNDSMAKKSDRVLSNEVRAPYLELLHKTLTENGEEVLVIGSNELAIPVVDSEGNERWVVFTVKVPTGDRSGYGYDGYAAAEDYQMKQKTKLEKAAVAAEKKAKKMAKRAEKLNKAEE